MELEFAILAEKAEASLNGPTHLWGAGLETIRVPSFPASYQFAAVVKMLAAANDLGRAHQVRLELTNPVGETKELTSIENARIPEPRFSDCPFYATFVMPLASSFSDPGGYTLRFFLDGAEVKSWLITVRQLDGLTGAANETTEAMAIRGQWMRQMGLDEDEIAEYCNEAEYPPNMADEQKEMEAMARISAREQE